MSTTKTQICTQTYEHAVFSAKSVWQQAASGRGYGMCTGQPMISSGRSSPAQTHLYGPMT
eukprot:2821113-Pleurochrysis_carterae.AAC.6